MGKQDRYNFEGADDPLGNDREQSAASTETEPDSSDETAPTTGDTADTGSTSMSSTTSVTEESDLDTDAVPSSTPEQSEFTDSSNEIPHRVRYDSPKDARTTKTFYLDKERDLARLRDLHSLAESEFDEKIHQLDVYLAAFRSNLSDDSFLLEMRRIGYGYFD